MSTANRIAMLLPALLQSPAWILRTTLANPTSKNVRRLATVARNYSRRVTQGFILQAQSLADDGAQAENTSGGLTLVEGTSGEPMGYLETLLAIIKETPRLINKITDDTRFATAGFLGVVAMVKTYDEYGPFDDNSRPNAVEHCYWGTLLANERSLNEAFAREAAAWWDAGPDEAGDRANTNRGIDIGLQGADSLETLWKKCDEAADLGKLTFSPPSATAIARVQLPSAVASDGSILVYKRWQGSGNIAMPNNWAAVNYTPTGWSNPVPGGLNDGQSANVFAIPGTHSITQNPGDVPVDYGWALRHKFTFSGGKIHSASITVRAEDLLDGIWVNNHLLGSIVTTSGTQNSGYNQVQYAIPRSVLNRGGSNVIALLIRNGSGNRTYASFLLEILLL
jgi:hypothetical protein